MIIDGGKVGRSVTNKTSDVTIFPQIEGNLDHFKLGIQPHQIND